VIVPGVGVVEDPVTRLSPKAPVGYIAHREPRPEWQEELDKISPVSTRGQLSWYKIHWESGEPWKPIQRWVIWQMHPLGKIPNWLDPNAFKGPHPRSTGHACFVGWCLCPVKKNRWVGGPPTAFGVDRVTYELFKDTGHYGSRFWIVQGSKGGHRRKYDEIEEAVAFAAKLPTEPPNFCDLPYAEPDQRTWAALRSTDRLSGGKDLIDAIRRNPAHENIEERARAEEVMQIIGKAIEAQVEPLVDPLYSSLRRTTDAEIVRKPKTELDGEKVNERFIKLGR
jgi:hypothetical protein